MNIILVSLHHVEYAVELANGLAEKNYVHLVLSKARVKKTIGEQFRDATGENISCTLLDKPSLWSPPTWKSVFSALRILLFTQYDVVHVQDSGNPLNLLFLFLSFRPVVMTIHDVNLHPGREQSSLRPWQRWIRGKIIKFGCDRVIVHGRNLRNLFLDNFDKPADAVNVVPLGCLFSFLNVETKSKPEEEPHTVLFFGRMEKYKGLQYLIQAEPLVSSKIADFKIIVAGEGEDLDLCKKGLLANQHFEVHDGFIPNNAVAYLFQRAAAVVLPYIEASQSGIAAIAFAFGKPVIATNVGSLPEIVRDGLVGKVVPAMEIEKIAGAIVDLLSNKEKRLEMGKEAFKMANGELGWRQIARLTEQIYLNVMRRPHS